MKTAEKNKLSGLLSRYILCDGAPVATQQRAYDAYMNFFTCLEGKYPQIDFRSEVFQQGLIARAKSLANTKVVRGPGASF
jgi:hypothetical protein